MELKDKTLTLEWISDSEYPDVITWGYFNNRKFFKLTHIQGEYRELCYLYTPNMHLTSDPKEIIIGYVNNKNLEYELVSIVASFLHKWNNEDIYISRVCDIYDITKWIKWIPSSMMSSVLSVTIVKDFVNNICDEVILKILDCTGKNRSYHLSPDEYFIWDNKDKRILKKPHNYTRKED